jgi:hypothetical protein
MVEVLFGRAGCASLMGLSCWVSGCPNQWAAAAVVMQAVTAGGNGCVLWPFWNIVLMAAHDETMAFISWLWLCVMQERFGRENAEESPPF